jgi:hypothetical protein
MTHPFTYEQAAEICEDFEDLEGTELIIHTDKPVKCDIEHVTIVPYERKDIEQYLEAYIQTNDIKVSLRPYTGTDFNVIILARNTENTEELIIQTIREYIDANGVRYNFPD